MISVVALMRPLVFFVLCVRGRWRLGVAVDAFVPYCVLLSSSVPTGMGKGNALEAATLDTAGFALRSLSFPMLWIWEETFFTAMGKSADSRGSPFFYILV